VMGEIESGRINVLRSRATTAAILFESLSTTAAWHALTNEMNPNSLAGRVRAAFDPSGLLNPGIMRVTR
jgi:hypothetical protein